MIQMLSQYHCLLLGCLLVATSGMAHCIITYDAGNATHRKFAECFKGVNNDTPGNANLACHNTTDICIWNYRDPYPNLSFKGTTNLKGTRFDIEACFYNQPLI